MWIALLTLAHAAPTAGQDFHVPLFVDALDDFWTVSVIGEVAIALTDADDTLSLVEGTLGRCPQVSTVVVRSEPQVPWSRSASVLMGLQSSRATLAIQGVPADSGATGGPPVQAEGRLRRAGDRAVLALGDGALRLDGVPICQDAPGEPLCGGDFRYLRSQLGGRDVAILAAQGAEAGLVLRLFDAVGDHDPVFAAERGDRLLRFEAQRLPDSEPWVVLPCERPLTPPESPR